MDFMVFPTKSKSREIKTTIALPFHSDHFDNVSRAMMAKESARLCFFGFLLIIALVARAR